MEPTAGPDVPATDQPPVDPAVVGDAADLSHLSFEDAIHELEDIVDGMEGGELSLQEALIAYQRGAALVGRCRESLEAVAQQVKVLEDGLLRPIGSDARPRGEGESE